MSPLSQGILLMPLLEAIRSLLTYGEYAAFQCTTHGFPCIVARTERGNVIASVTEDGMYALDTAGRCYACDPNGSKDAIRNVIRRALNDAREEWT